MWFNFVLINHGSVAEIDALKPLTDYMQGVLSRCGHESTISFNQVEPNAINIFFENFQPAFVNELLKLKKIGAKIGIIATELMIDNHIPYGRHGITYLGLEGPNDQINQQRVDCFNALVPEVDFIWAFLERTADSYKSKAKLCEFFPVGYLSGGLTPPPTKAPKDLDVLMFGKSTPHRLLVLDKVRKFGINLHCIGSGFNLGYIPHMLLSSYLDRTKICLNLTLHSQDDSQCNVDPRFVSCMRVKELFDRNICVVSEEIPFDNPYKNYMVSADVDSLGKVLQEILAEDKWQSLGASLAKGFVNDMDVLNLCNPIIQRTIHSLEQNKV